MARLKTREYPILVRREISKGGAYYRVRPLFIEIFEAYGKRLDRAISKLNKELREYYQKRHYVNDLEGLGNLYWIFLDVPIQERIFPIEFQVKNHWISGGVFLVTFELKDQTVFLLPDFSNFFFVREKSKAKWKDISAEIEVIIRELLREKLTGKGKNINVSPYLASKEEFVIWQRLNLKFSPPPLRKIETERKELLTFGGEKFDGSEEVRKVGKDLTELYPNELKRAFYRDEIVTKIMNLLFEKDIKVSIALIGPRGVGKTSIIHEALRRYISQNRNKDFESLVKIWHIDPNRIIAGMSVISWWQKRLEAIFDYVSSRKFRKGRLISDKVYFDNVIALFRVGMAHKSNISIADVLKFYLEEKKISVILEATPEEWQVAQELNRRFTDLFRVIRVYEPSYEDSLRVILKEKRRLEAQRGVKITLDAINEARSLKKAYFKEEAMPGSIIKLLSQVSTRRETEEVTKEDILKSFSSLYGVREEILFGEKAYTIDDVFDFFRNRLIGQEEAVKALTDLIMVIKSGLNNPEKPLASFLFIGPTGVGKTKSAKILTEFLLGSEEKLIKLDMNEYVDEDAVSRLIGNRNTPEGHLTSKIRFQPFSVILLDEIEKAHPSVHDLLLQVLGEGRLTDALGRSYSFTKCVIIMTSNLGASEAHKKMGFVKTEEELIKTYRKAVEEFFKPEFLNRIDKIVPFKYLSLESIKTISKIFIKEILQREGFVRRLVFLNVSAKASDKIAQKGYDPTYGARALRRAIEQELTDFIADQLVSIPPESPIFLEIFWHKGKLTPRVRPLKEQRPVEKKLPVKGLKMTELFEVYKYFESRINTTKEKLIGEIKQGKRRNKKWELQILIEETKELEKEILKMTSDFEEVSINSKTGSLHLPLPGRQRMYKGVTKSLKRLWHVEKSFLMDLIIQRDIRRYLLELYNKSEKIVDEARQQYLKHFIDLGILGIKSNDIMRSKSDFVLIQMRSLVADYGKKEINFLSKTYEEILEQLKYSIVYQHSDSPTKKFVVAEGPGLYKLFKGESGVHLFYPYMEPPNGVLVRIIKVPKRKRPEDFVREKIEEKKQWIESFEMGKAEFDDDPEELGDIVRIYSLSWGKRKDDTVMDLKLNWIIKGKVDLEQWKLTFYQRM